MCLIAAPLFVNTEQYKQKFETSFKQSTGLDIKVNGSVTVTYLPLPKIEVTNVTVKNDVDASVPHMFSAQQVTLWPYVDALIFGTALFKEIHMVGPVVEIETLTKEIIRDGAAVINEADNNKRHNWQAFSNRMASLTLEEGTSILPRTVKIENGTVIFRSAGKRTSLDYIDTQLDLNLTSGAPITFDGKFESQANPISYSLSVNEASEEHEYRVDVSIKAPHFDADFIGDAIYRNSDDYNMAGSLDISSDNLGQFVLSFLPDNIFLSKIKSDESFALKGKVVVSDKETSLSDIEFKSKSIHGKGMLERLYNNTNISWDFALEIDSLNLDSLLQETEEDTTKSNTIDYYSASRKRTGFSNLDLNLSHNISGLFYINAKEIIYNKQKMTDLILNADIYFGTISLHSLTANMPGNSRLSFSGDITNNGIRPFLKGSTTIYGQKFRPLIAWLYPEATFIAKNKMGEFIFNFDIESTPQKTSISNLKLNFDKNIISGEMDYRPSIETPTLKLDFKAARMNLDKYNFSHFISQRLKNKLYGLETLSIEDSWVSRLNLDAIVTFQASEVIYNKRELKSIILSTTFKPNILKVQNFTIRSNSLDFDSKLSVDLRRDIPDITFDFSSNRFDTKALILQNDSTIQNNESPLPPILKDFSSLGLANFNSTMDVNISSLQHNNFLVNDLVFQADINSRVLNLKKFEGNFLGAKTKFTGSFSISSSPSFSFSGTTQGLDIQRFLKALGYEDSPLSGNIILNFSAKSKGQNFNEWRKALILQSEFAIQNFIIDGIDIPRIIINSSRQFSVIDMNKIIADSLESGKTAVSSLRGKIEIENSLLKARDLKFSAPSFSGSFAGNMSLNSFQTRSIAKIFFRPLRNKVVDISFNIDGAIGNLRKTLDTTNLEKFITDRAK